MELVLALAQTEIDRGQVMQTVKHKKPDSITKHYRMDFLLWKKATGFLKVQQNPKKRGFYM